MPETRNLCAQVPIDLHQKISEAREQAGLTTAQCQRRCDFVIFRRTQNVRKRRVKVYSH